MTATDDDLIRAIAVGDVAAFEELYRRHVQRVLGFCVRRCRDAHEVSELCASVFLAVWEKAASFDPDRGDVGAWMNGIAANRLVDLRRGEQRQVALRERLVERRVLDTDDVERLTEQIDAARAAEPVAAVVQSLPTAQQEVIALVGVDGLSAAEAAQELGSTPTAVRMRLSRARRNVRSLLGLESAVNIDDSPEVLQ